MSLWTPGGEHEVPRDQPAQPPAPGSGGPPGAEGLDLDDLPPEERARAEEMIRQMAEAQRRIVEAPVEEVIANHLVGFYELAALHLQQQPPNLEPAQLAIDALSAVVDALGGRLGPLAGDLKQLQSNIQMVFVQVRDGGPVPD